MYILYFFTIVLSLQAQTFGEMEFRHLELSQASVVDVIQDSYGFMWFATQEGLNRYDAYSIKVFRNDELDSNTVISNNLTCLYEDKDQNIWVGSQSSGLSIYIRNKNHFIHFTHNKHNSKSLSSNEITKIIEDENGTIWIATMHGLNKYNSENRTFSRFLNDSLISNSISSNKITSMNSDRKGKIYLGTINGGVNILNNITNTFTILKDHQNKAVSINKEIIAVSLGINNQLWVGADD